MSKIVGRRENPVVRDIAEVGTLADFQREWRHKAGLSYDQLAKATGESPTTLRRAASGTCVPPRKVLLAAITACGGPTERAIHLWKQARYHQRLVDTPHKPGPPADLVHDKFGMRAALVELYESDGAPTMAEMHKRAGGRHGKLPPSTAHRIANGETVPATLAQFEAYLDAVEVRKPAQRGLWVQAWNRVHDSGPTALPDPRSWSPNWIFAAGQIPNYLIRLYESVGSPPSLEMKMRTGSRLDPRTARRILTGHMPPDIGAFTAFLDACRVKPEARKRWLDAWHRTHADRMARAI
ncbi:helix-turn-helix domain-containing protein [Streptomyces montanus]|uniref:helix-turn-helix domain-containing protein n=1 Tax=Streptomyces montanus TaxID=2580423 RepID=UPI00248228A8|nr:helix-turn-helix transcriptional regulator [Streptomyces montanus]